MIRVKDVEARYEAAVNETSRLYAIIYSDESNKLFDELHDSVYYQYQGVMVTYNEMLDAIESPETVTDSQLRQFWIDAGNIEILNHEIQMYFDASKRLHPINWIF